LGEKIPVMSLDSTTLWLIAGVVLCVMELLLPTAFVESAMGVSAFLVALTLLVFPELSLSLQVILWLVLSLSFLLGLRRFVPKGRSPSIEEAVEAETMTEILPGQTGRVLYEGNSWAAKCGDEELAIAANQKVYVISRKGNTLIVLPDSLLHAPRQLTD
jgi:membrane protein implicated in regulation of membrane protease activity